MTRSIACLSVCLCGLCDLGLAAAEPGKAQPRELVFRQQGERLVFDTGLVKGQLRSGDKAPSQGITALRFGPGDAPVAAFYGLMSHYRLLDADARYGTAAWDWQSKAELLADGRVQVRWTADDQHPFHLSAVYAWTGTDTLDVTTSVTPTRNLRGFEVYLASYCQGFPASFVYAQQAGGAAILEAKQSGGEWQIFPRDDAAAQRIGDGRWQREPHPVQWAVGPRLAAPLGLRRDATTGLAVLVMAPPADCFAVSMPYGEEWHRSLYLSLFGRDIAANQTATARARLVVGHQISNERAIELYRRYEQQIGGAAGDARR